jgi:FtsP/CotA-like multicopper oxidase with cupredoxin domain
MSQDTTRRNFLRGAAAVGLLAAEGLPTSAAEDADADYPRDHPGVGGPVGSATDRGKLVAGFRKAGAPPIPVVTPDLEKLPFELIDGVKEFHLHAMHTRREFLPGAWMDVWGYNDLCPGPTIEVTEGDRVRIVMHNMLPESTILHIHGLEGSNRIDGVHGVTQEAVPPGGKVVYEFTLRQNGTLFYHSHGPMQEGLVLCHS